MLYSNPLNLALAKKYIGEPITKVAVPLRNMVAEHTALPKSSTMCVCVRRPRIRRVGKRG
jgi:hypothetical protein